jgi:hypothetical protein
LLDLVSVAAQKTSAHACTFFLHLPDRLPHSSLLKLWTRSVVFFFGADARRKQTHTAEEEDEIQRETVTQRHRGDGVMCTALLL